MIDINKELTKLERRICCLLEYDEVSYSQVAKVALKLRKLEKGVNNNTFLKVFVLDKIAKLKGLIRRLYCKVCGGESITYFEYPQDIFPFTMEIYRTGNTEGENYFHTFDTEAFKNSITGTIAYVDPVNGNNSNNGSSWALAKRTIINTITSTSANIIYLRPGYYSYVNGIQGTAISRNISLICEDGVAIVTTGAEPADLIFTADENYPTIYSGVYSPTGVGNNAIDRSNLDESGLPFRLVPVASPEAVVATPNSIYTNTSTRRVYVRLFDDRAPDADFLYLRILPNLNSQNIYNIYAENVHFWGSNTSAGGAVAYLHNTNSSVTKEVVFNNCRFDYGPKNGVAISYYTKAVFLGGGSSHNSEDGYDYREVYSSGFEFDVNCSHNGYDGSTANNGSTGHDGSRVITVGGKYFYNRGKAIQDIRDSYRFLVGTKAGYSTSSSYDDSFSFAVGVGSAGDNTTFYSYECTSEGANPGWRVFVNAILYYKDGNFDETTNLIQGTATPIT